MKHDSKIYIAGHNGMVGSSIHRTLIEQWHTNIITASRKELDLTQTDQVAAFFEKKKPEYVFLAAAKVGGIGANNDYPADFIYQNLTIQNNIIHQSYLHQVTKLLFLGSTCIYPKLSQQPIKEEYLLTGELEPTNEPYAIAKIAGIKMCQSYNRQYGTNFIATMPTNLYGENDNFDPQTGHVLPALIYKMHQAKITNKPAVTLWWNGSALREFLYVDDAASACIYMMKKFTIKKNNEENIFLNIGTGVDISIKQLAQAIQKVVGFEWEIIRDTTKPNGTPKKLSDVSQIHALGWKHTIDLAQWIEKTYKHFLQKQKSSA